MFEAFSQFSAIILRDPMWPTTRSKFGSAGRCRCSQLSLSNTINRLQVWLRGFGLFFLVRLILASSALAQDPATVGQWSSVMTWPYMAVHAHVLPTGKVLWWPSFSLGDNPQLWNPATNVITAAPKAGANIFCSGHAFLPDGRLLVGGGHIDDLRRHTECQHL